MKMTVVQVFGLLGCWFLSIKKENTSFEVIILVYGNVLLNCWVSKNTPKKLNIRQNVN